ncbi:MAG: hypothetical protein ACOYXC_09550 [Candidatus Rifleibacteriota bacterium]
MNRMKQFERNLLGYLKRRTDYAIQLFGNWGSGKTFYVKNVLIPKIRKYIKSEKNKGKIDSKFFLHVSLHGVKNPIELDQRIFYAMVPLFESREAGRWAASIRAVFAAASLGKVKLSFDDWLNYRMIILPRLKEILLFLDDVERASQPIEMLKYISEMVENHGLKAVVVCNYEKLEAEGLTEVREKLIRYSFEFIANSKDFIVAYAQRKNIRKSYQAFIISHIQNLEILHGEDSLQNLRLLNDALDTFRKIFTNIRPFRNLPPSELIQRFLQILIMTNFYYNSKIRSDFEKYCEENSKKAYGQKELLVYYFLSSKFSKFGLLGDLPKPVVELIKNGCFDSNGIQAAWCPKIVTKEQRAERVLSTWWNQGDKEVKEVLEEILVFIKENKYSLKELFSIGFHALEMANDGVYVLEAMKLHETIKSHIQVYPIKENIPIDFDDVTGDLWIKLDNKKGDARKALEEFKQFFEAEVFSKNEVIFDSSAEELVNALKNNPARFKEMAYQIRIKSVIDAFFQKLAKSNFPAVLLDIEVSNLREVLFGIKYLAELSSENSQIFMENLAMMNPKEKEDLPSIKCFWVKKIFEVFDLFKKHNSEKTLGNED